MPSFIVGNANDINGNPTLMLDAGNGFYRHNPSEAIRVSSGDNIRWYSVGHPMTLYDELGRILESEKENGVVIMSSGIRTLRSDLGSITFVGPPSPPSPSVVPANNVVIRKRRVQRKRVHRK